MTHRLDLQLSGLSCAGCVRRAERAAQAVPGVQGVAVNLATQRAAIDAEAGLDVAALSAALGQAGYPVAVETIDLPVAGMTCAGCAGRVERALLAVPGVISASVNLASLHVRVQAGGVAAAALEGALARAGYTAGVAEAAAAARDWELPLAVLACVLALPLLAPMVLMPFGVDAALPGWVQLGLGTVIQLGFGARFYRAAWRAARQGAASMDTLVAVGSTAAFGLSVWLLAVHGPGHLYFEASAAVIALVRLGKWLELRARQEAGAAIRALDRLRPATARVRRDGGEAEVAVAALRPGDQVVVRPGERLPADGVVREGEGGVDESLLTGEAMAVAKRPGSAVVGGSLATDAMLVIEATTLGAESRLAQMVRLIEGAQAGKPPIQRMVDRVSAVFVPAVLVLAVVTLGAWLLAGAGMEAAVVNAVSVLVIACPCALGLATPAAIMVGTGVAARHGILIRDAGVIERAHTIGTVVFDKTGTLTEGRPSLVAVHPAAGMQAAEVVRLAAALQAGSEHPLARAVLADGRAAGAPVAAGLRAVPGRGIGGVVDGRRLALGNARLMADEGVDASALATDAAELEAAGRTVAWLGPAGGPALGVLGFGDAVRAGAAQAVAALRGRGMRVALLTGDNAGAAAAVAAALAVDEVVAGALPEDKAAFVAGRRGGVAMVGDGVNDAAALAAADIGIAMAAGTDAAMGAAGITLMRGDLALVPAALDIAARTRGRIWRGLGWAFAYNLVGLPLAALGYLSPVVAGAAMAFSSAAVVGSALMLRRWRPR